MMQNLLGVLHSIRFVDLVDVSIIATSIYIAVIWFETARARFVLIGLCIMLAVYLLSIYFHLYLTTMMFRGFFAVLLIIIVVIFQDELRNFFERVAVWSISRGRMRGRPLTSAQDTAVGVLVNVLGTFSRKRTGALIVVKGLDPLERYLEAGSEIDAALNPLLLESLFDAHTPTHDGAVVIAGGRVAMFGCHLPLSANMGQLGKLGTRHAAALGLAERTDALCAVVSEETGMVSVGVEGKLIRLGDISRLGPALETFYRKRYPRENTVMKRLAAGHLWEKALAVAVACVLWCVFGAHSNNVRRDIVVPVEYQNLSASLYIKEPKPKDVSLTLSGPERAFNLLRPGDLKVRLDLSGAREGQNDFWLTKDNIRYPAQLQFVSIYPGKLTAYLYRMAEAKVPIIIRTSGALPDGLTVKHIDVRPRDMTLLFPDFVEVGKRAVLSEPIDLSAIAGTVNVTPKLIIPVDAKLPDNGYPDVRARIDVEKKDGAR